MTSTAPHRISRAQRGARTRTGWRLLAAAVAISGGLGGASLAFSSSPAGAAPQAQVQTDPAADEARFVEAINAYRAQNGLSALVPDAELLRVARNWSAQMRAAGEISHNPNLRSDVKANWRKLGENVGVGPTVADLHQAFIDSPAHRRNLLDPSFQRVGIGIVYDTDGTIFVTEQFMELQPTPTSQATQVEGVTVTNGQAPSQLALSPKAAAGTRPAARPATTVKKTTKKR